MRDCIHSQSGDLWFLYHNNALLLLEDDQGGQYLPRFEPGASCLPQSRFLCQPMGEFEGLNCFAQALEEVPAETPAPGLRWVCSDMRFQIYDYFTPSLYKLAGKGRQLAYWDTHSQYCPGCGAKTVRKPGSLSKTCLACHYSIRPPIYVAIMVAVLRSDEILLIRTHKSAGNWHALVAGFLEPGESMEECVKREVMEETGLSICNVRYQTSQSWPHVSNLMVGFYADYVSGEIKIQEEELTGAAFFHRDRLPGIPHPYSLTHHLITWWAAGKTLPVKFTPE